MTTPTPCKILYNDVSEDASFSGPAWNPLLTNMQDPRVTKVARSADATLANTQFFMSFADPVTVPGIIFVGTNITANAKYRYTAYSDAGFSIQTFTTGLQNAFAPGTVLRDPDFKGYPLIGLFGQNVTSSYWLVEIQDTANPANYIELGKLFMGSELNLSANADLNFAPNSSFVRDPNTQTQKALNGTPYFSRHKNIRTWNLVYPTLETDVLWDEVDVLNEASGLDRAIFVIPFPDDTMRIWQQSFLGRLAKIDPLTLLMTTGSTGFTITEYIG